MGQHSQIEINIPAYLKISKIIVYIVYAWSVFGIIVLGLRVFLLAFSANATTPFVNFVFKTSADYLQPFRGIFPPKSFGETGYLDVAAMFAMVMYLMVAWGFSAMVNYVQRRIDESADKERRTLEQKAKSSRQSSSRRSA